MYVGNCTYVSYILREVYEVNIINIVNDKVRVRLDFRFILP